MHKAGSASRTRPDFDLSLFFSKGGPNVELQQPLEDSSAFYSNGSTGSWTGFDGPRSFPAIA